MQILLKVNESTRRCVECVEKYEKWDFRAVSNSYKPPQNLYFIQYIYSFSMPYFEDWQIVGVCNRLHLENKFFQRQERNMWDIYS